MTTTDSVAWQNILLIALILVTVLATLTLLLYGVRAALAARRKSRRGSLDGRVHSASVDMNAPPFTERVVMHEATNPPVTDPDGAAPSLPATPPAAADETSDLPTATESMLPPEQGLYTDAPPLLPVLPTDSWAWASFGERGRVLPAPSRLTKQPTDVSSQVADTAIEWADIANLSIRGLSVRGHSHRHEGSVRQDDFAVGEVGRVIVCAVADGVGAEPTSHVGAALVSRIAVTWQPVQTLLAERSAQFDCASIRTELQLSAQRLQIDPDRLSTTLTFAVIPRTPVMRADGVPSWHVAIAQIGDSHAYLLRADDSWVRVTMSDDAPSEMPSNVVTPLPKYSVARVWHVDMTPGDVLALTTDGIGNLLEDQPEFAHAVAAHYRHSAPSPSALLYVLDAAVKSYDDDRTFLAIRFESAP